MGKLEQKQKEKRKKIVNAATKLFAFNGYSDTTISKIAKEAGISFGSVFTYFETKELLFETIILEPLQNMKKQLYNLPEGPITATKLKEMTSNHVDIFIKQRIYLQLIQQVIGQPEKFPKLFKQIDILYEDWVQKLAQFIKQCQEEQLLLPGEPEGVSRGYISFLIGMRLTLAESATPQVWNYFYIMANRVLGLKETANEI